MNKYDTVAQLISLIKKVFPDLNLDETEIVFQGKAIPKNPETDFQTIVYLLCVDKILKDYEALKFIYIDLKNGKNFE